MWVSAVLSVTGGVAFSISSLRRASRFCLRLTMKYRTLREREDEWVKLVDMVGGEIESRFGRWLTWTILRLWLNKQNWPSRMHLARFREFPRRWCCTTRQKRISQRLPELQWWRKCDLEEDWGDGLGAWGVMRVVLNWCYDLPNSSTSTNADIVLLMVNARTLMNISRVLAT